MFGAIPNIKQIFNWFYFYISNNKQLNINLQCRGSHGNGRGAVGARDA